MLVRPRLRWTLVAALAAHAGAAAWAWQRAGEGASQATEVESETATQVDIEIEPSPAEAPAAPADTEGESVRVPRIAARPTATAALAGGAVNEVRQAPAASSEAPPGDGTWSFSPTTGGAPSGGGPLVGGALDAAVRAGVGATVAEDEKRKNDPRRRPMAPFTARDVELGLVPGGALVTLARDRVRQSRAPMVSHALLEFDTDGAGIVARVRVLDASSGRSEWDEVAARIAADARARPPMHVPAGASGVAVTLELTSAEKTVNGGTPTNNPLTKALGALTDPVGAMMDSRTPAQRVVAARIVDVKAF